MPITILHCPSLLITVNAEQTEQPAMAMPSTVIDRVWTTLSGTARQPDLVVISGNLAECAETTEYETTYTVLTRLRDELGLAPRQVIVVPGRHDVNRRLCQRHFDEREADGLRPTPPYWDKWQPLATMLRRFHGAELPKDQPWSLTEFPDLRLVVAGLNSTMADSHRTTDPHGHLGPEQVAWFADRLAGPGYHGWLRVGVLHHRPDHPDDPQPAGGRLADADGFAERLAPHLDAVLHGQPGSRWRTLLGPRGLPVLTGAHQHGWQVVELHGDHLIQRVGDRTTGRVHLPRPPARRRGSGAPAPTARDRLLESVTEICRLRYPGAEVTPVPWPGPATSGYVRLAPDWSRDLAHRAPAGQCPVGVCDAAPDPDDIQRFIDEVLARFRTGGAAPDAALVHTGPPAPGHLRDWAKGRGIDLVPFREFQLGNDLVQFAERQAAALGDDAVYPEDLYVPQRYAELGQQPQPEPGTAPRPDLLRWLRTWIDQPAGRLVMVLGTFGHGKTFLLRQLARRMSADGCQTVPVLIDLRGLEESYSLDELVAVQLSRTGQRRIDLEAFRYLRRAGRVALLFDGFDELATRVSYDRAVDHLRTIIQAAERHAKVVVTSRDQHFFADADVLSAVGTRADRERRVVRLAGFDDEQIRQFLTNRIKDRAAAASRLDLLRGLKDLLGLSRSPRMLAFIIELDEAVLRDALHHEGVTAATLYQRILDRWLEHEAGRLAPLESRAPSRADLGQAVIRLALRQWGAADDSLGIEDLDAAATAIEQLTSATISESAGLEPMERAHMLGSSTLLVRTGDGRFTFVHHSVRDWLVARHLADQLTAPVEPGATATSATGHLLGRPMPPLMIECLCDLAGPENVRAWAERALNATVTAAGVRRNAVEVLHHLGVTAPAPPNLAGLDLRGKDFSGQVLREASLGGANLTDARLAGADLTAADLSGATLIRARMERASLARADLSGADLTGARLLGADLDGTTLAGARLCRAALVGARNIALDTDRAEDVIGMALPGDGPPQLQVGSFAVAHAVAADSRTRLVAGGGVDGVIRIWDAATGLPLRMLTGHTGPVHAVAYAPDGRHLASAGADGTIRIWDTAAGQVSRVLLDHTGWIRAVAYAPDGRHLASAGHDATIRVWDTATGEISHRLDDHTGWIHTLTYAPDGAHLASAGADETIRIWDTSTGRLSHRLDGHTGTIHAVAFSPAGDQLASAGDERLIHLWDLTTGSILRTLTGHTGWIRTITYLGDRLASAGDDGTIRIWDTATGDAPAVLAGHGGWIRSLAGYHDGRRLASAGDDGTIRIWDTTGSGWQLRALGGDGAESRALCFAGHGRWLASGTSDGTVHLWSQVGAPRLRTLTGPAAAITALARTPDSERLAGAAADGSVAVWRPSTGELLHTVTGHTGAVRALAYADGGRYLVTAGVDGYVRLWNRSGRMVRTLAGHTGTVNDVAVRPAGGHLASASDDSTIRIWEVAAGTEVRALTGHTGPVRAIGFAPGTDHLASAGTDGSILVWDIAAGRPVQTLDGHPSTVTTLEFAPDGRYLVSAGTDGVVRVWDIPSGEVLTTIVLPYERAPAIAHVPGGRALASAGSDRATRIWDPITAQPLVTLIPLAGGGSAVARNDLRSAVDGPVRGEFWYAIGLCRFEPGELDAHVSALQPVPAELPLW